MAMVRFRVLLQLAPKLFDPAKSHSWSFVRPSANIRTLLNPHKRMCGATGWMFEFGSRQTTAFSLDRPTADGPLPAPLKPNWSCWMNGRFRALLSPAWWLTWGRKLACRMVQRPWSSSDLEAPPPLICA